LRVYFTDPFSMTEKAARCRDIHSRVSRIAVIVVHDGEVAKGAGQIEVVPAAVHRSSEPDEHIDC